MEWVNSRGIKYYLYCKTVVIGRNKIQRINYFFSKTKTGSPMNDIPTGYKVSETPYGMPVLKKL
jgi:hypothetical protein